MPDCKHASEAYDKTSNGMQSKELIQSKTYKEPQKKVNYIDQKSY